MARPETIDDLPDRDELITVVEIRDTKLTELNSSQLLAVGKAAKALYMVFVKKRENGCIRYCRLPFDDELKERLTRAQELWDYREKRYNAALAGKTPKHDFERHYIDIWAAEEGLEPIDWEAIDKANDKGANAAQ